MKQGEPERFDYEYERKGTCSLFLACEPLSGRRFVRAGARRTKLDFAQFVKELIDIYYPDAEKIVLVMDNLNTHTPSSFYEAFVPEEARRLSAKLEIHYTPKHGSWLNMAEIELAVLVRQCLSDRIPALADVQKRVAAWQDERNQTKARIDWRFTAADARIKLTHLYPVLK